MNISANYRRIDVEDIDALVALHADAWKDPRIPARQDNLSVRHELESYRAGSPCAPFDALVACLRVLPVALLSNPEISILDVGASFGYYSEVLKIGGFKFKYTGLDFSPAFAEYAQQRFPGIEFKVGDARALPYPDEAFDIVLSGCCMIHTKEYPKIVAETARVMKRYAVFHRTPILISPNSETTYYVKEAYGIPCVEIHFAEREVLNLFSKNGLRVIAVYDVFMSGDFGHREYLVKKQ